MLDLLARGRAVKQAGHELGLALGTSWELARRILIRLDAETYAEAVGKATALGLVRYAGMVNLYSPDSEAMTPRLRRTLLLIAEGYENAEIAHKEGVGAETVKSRVKVLFRRYGARNRAHLVTLAFEGGDIERWRE